MTHLGPKNTPPVEHLETALAKNLGRRIPKQLFRPSVPRNDLSLIAHRKGGICGPLKEGKQLTLEHSKTPKCTSPSTATSSLLRYAGGVLKIQWALLQVYDHKWAARQQAAALATAEWHRRLASDIFTEIPERLIKIHNLIFRCSLPHGGHLS